MGDHDDKVFMKRFSGVIAGLVIVTILIMIIAIGYDKQQEEGANPSRNALTDERIAPVGSVRTELTEQAPAADTVAEEAAGAAEVVAAEMPAVAGSGIDGAAIYNSACMACHASGAAGAPIPGSDAWAERVAKGAETLIASAINGLGIMPPKGGRPDFSDDEIKAAVEYMLAQ